jgi:hypothetical protein
MSAPNGIAKDDSGNVYVADRGNHRILKFSRSGQFLLSFGSLGGTSGVLAPRTDYAAGDFPNSVAVGDFNRDGIPDAVVANRNRHTISVMLGDGSGAFPNHTEISVGLDPYAVAVGDFGDGDGRLDLAVADYSGGQIFILLGNGTGGFTPAGAYDAESEPWRLAVKDVNGNGRPDLIAVNEGSLSVSVLLDSEGESFSAATNYTTGGEPIGLAVGDVTGDGRPDILTANFAGPSVSLFRNLGGGTFTAKTDIPFNGAPYDVAIPDLDRDGFADIVVTTHSANSIEVRLGLGGGGFNGILTFPTVPGGTNPTGLAIGDVNGDGRLDVVTANQVGDNASLLLGDGTGAFAAAVNFPPAGAPNRWRSPISTATATWMSRSPTRPLGRSRSCSASRRRAAALRATSRTGRTGPSGAGHTMSSSRTWTWTTFRIWWPRFGTAP